jgi:hypothetical protein
MRNIRGHRLRLTQHPVGARVEQTVEEPGVVGPATSREGSRGHRCLAHDQAGLSREEWTQGKDHEIEMDHSGEYQVRLEFSQQAEQGRSRFPNPARAERVHRYPRGNALGVGRLLGNEAEMQRVFCWGQSSSKLRNHGFRTPTAEVWDEQQNGWARRHLQF